MKHLLNAMRQLAPDAAPLLDAFEQDCAEMDADFERRREQSRRRFEARRAEQAERFHRTYSPRATR